MTIRRRWLGLPFALAMSAQAEVTFDGTTGGPSGVLRGAIEIGEQDGLLTPSADALLHSLGVFNVQLDESVAFSHDTASVQNIIARVTGGELSRIDGTLTSDAPLWLLNPAGVMVGADARIDVPGVLRVNAATGPAAALVLADGSLLTVDADLNTLTVARPAAFGLTSDLPADPGTRVAADGSLGTIVAAAPAGDGTSFTVTGGTESGDNLFHSFEHFSVFSEDALTFSSGRAQPFDNLIGRVTGNAASYLTGTLRTDGSGMTGTSLWLVNPAGMFLGAGAVLDVGKSFNLGAADFVATGSGQAFFADPNAGPSTLFSGSPATFGFTAGSSAGALRIADFTYDQAGRTSNTPGDGILLSGATVDLDGVGLLLESDAAHRSGLRLEAPGGQVLLTDTDIHSTGRGSANAGRLELEGAMLVANGTALRVTTQEGDPQAQPSRIRAAFTESVALGDTAVSAATDGAADSGSVTFETPVFLMLGGSLSTTTRGSGDAGGVVVSVNDAGAAGSTIGIVGGARLESDAGAGSDGAGAGGVFLIGAESVVLAGEADAPIQVLTRSGAAAGSAGSILLQGTDVTLGNLIVASNSASLRPDVAEPGSVLIFADAALTLDAVTVASNSSGAVASAGAFLQGTSVSILDSSISATASGSGAAGTLRIAADTSLDVLGATTISNATTGPGEGASTVLESQGTLVVDGAGATVALSSASTAIANGGAAGRLSLTAAESVAINGASFAANAVSGSPGFVAVSAPVIALDNSVINVTSQSDLNTTATGGLVRSIALLAQDRLSIGNSVLGTITFGAGDAAPILLTGLDLRLSDSAVLGTTAGAGQGASIFLSGPLLADGTDLSEFAEITVAGSAIASESVGSGRFGTINVASRNTRISDSVLSVQTASPTPAPPGTDLLAVLLDSADKLEIIDSQLLARTVGAMDAGRITLSAGEIAITSSSVSSSSTGSGAAGQILIGGGQPDAGTGSVAIEDGAVIESDTTDGTAGQVLIVSGGALRLAGVDTRITASSSGAADTGLIAVQAGSMDIVDGASIESRATGTGDSNRIEIVVLGPLRLRGASSAEPAEILTDAVQSRGGDVAIATAGPTDLGEAAIVASAGAQGSGGNILLNVNGLLAGRSLVLARAEAGNGGRIDIDPLLPGALFLIDGESFINADSETGTAGTVEIDAPDTGINAALAPREVRIDAQPDLARDACRPAAEGSQSTFYVRAEPVNVERPDGYLPISGAAPSARRGSAAGDCP